MSQIARGDLFPPGEYIRDELEARNWTPVATAGLSSSGCLAASFASNPPQRRRAHHADTSWSPEAGQALRRPRARPGTDVFCYHRLPLLTNDVWRTMLCRSIDAATERQDWRPTRFARLIPLLDKPAVAPGAMRGLHFKQLQGDRAHQHSLRLNDQWRLIVEIVKAEPKNIIAVIRIEDYH